MRKLSYFIIILGVLIILLPKTLEWYDDRNQQKLLEQVENSFYEELNDPVDEPVIASYDRLSQLLEQASEDGQTTPLPLADSSLEPSPSTPVVPIAVVETKPKPEAIAIIHISRINLKLPILAGASEENMKQAAVYMTETTEIGKVGNTGIAAHRARTKGRLFNRLDELSSGDEIVIKSGKQTYTYAVYAVSRVLPNDVSVLNRNKKDSILTLITCDPITDPTHRLIVHARLIE